MLNKNMETCFGLLYQTLTTLTYNSNIMNKAEAIFQTQKLCLNDEGTLSFPLHDKHLNISGSVLNVIVPTGHTLTLL